MYKKIQTLTNNFGSLFPNAFQNPNFCNSHSRSRLACSFVVNGFVFVIYCHFFSCLHHCCHCFVIFFSSCWRNCCPSCWSTCCAIQLVSKMPGCVIFEKSLGICHSPTVSSKFLLSASYISVRNILSVRQDSSICYQLYSFLVKKRGIWNHE